MVDVAEMAILQEADIRLDAFKRQLQDFDDQLGEPPFAAALKAEVEAEAALLTEVSRSRETADADATATRAKIETEDQKLYSGTITDPRELKILQEEVFALRRLLKSQEEVVLARIEQEELAQEATTYLSALTKKSAKAWSERQTDLSERRVGVADQAALVEGEVKEQRDLMAQADLAVYDDHRSRRPLAVSAVEGGVCGSCRLALPTTILTRARRGVEAVLCPACSCIVYLQ